MTTKDKYKTFYRMPWRRKKNVKVQTHFFSDQVIRDFSVISCQGALFFPEPLVHLDEFGAISDVPKERATLRFNNDCIVHLCEIPGVPPEFHLAIDDTGEECKV